LSGTLIVVLTIPIMAHEDRSGAVTGDTATATVPASRMWNDRLGRYVVPQEADNVFEDNHVTDAARRRNHTGS
jgi:hypothetical protein